jgi:hypothetical protein
MTNLGLGNDMTADLGDVLMIINLLALAVFIVTVQIGRIERGAAWLIERLHKMRWMMHKPLE